MKNFLILTFLSLLSLSHLALAECKVAVGGPGANQGSLTKLSSALGEMFDKHKELKIEVYTISSLPEAVSTEADYVVFLKGSSEYAQVEFINLNSNTVLSDNQYQAGQGLSGAILKITADVESKIVPNLPSYCH